MNSTCWFDLRSFSFNVLIHLICIQWYAIPRPEGARCLVIANGGETISRKRNGAILHRFPSAFPSGSRSDWISTRVAYFVGLSLFVCLSFCLPAVCLLVISLSLCILFLFGFNCIARATHSGKAASCVLDCIYQQRTRTYYIVDIMCWKGYALYDSTTEFRYVVLHFTLIFHQFICVISVFFQRSHVI